MIKYIIILIVGCLGVYWYQIDVYVEPGVSCGLVAKDIRLAMVKMGPGKQYRLFPDGTLQVKVENQWLRLRY